MSHLYKWQGKNIRILLLEVGILHPKDPQLFLLYLIYQLRFRMDRV